ncbi:PREDICTED: MADS-box transcription factor 47-like [Nicotiana attenuata]|uniref:MADS-box transcription factor 47-like n=1 Tax=Nicotiana attenuata TaxID=49451 RepID=UPI00090578E3|nr:PREDICTED: MADS-box transcription factor 47-like [Nicotiana attenuata]
MVNEHRRSVVLQERMETLFKKAEELSVLCDVEIGIIVFSPDKKNVVYEWPSRDKFKQLLMRYLDKPLVERLKKLTTFANEDSVICISRCKNCHWCVDAAVIAIASTSIAIEKIVGEVQISQMRRPYRICEVSVELGQVAFAIIWSLLRSRLQL